MLSISTQNRLANTIYAVADAEKKTETSRQFLAEQSLFEPYTAFRRLDQQRNGELKLSDLIEFLGDNNITPNQDEAAYLFKKFDLDRDGRITYPDFLRALLPREDSRLRSVASLRESYYLEKNMLLPAQVERALAQLMQQELINYSYLSSIKAQLVNSLDYNSLEAFRTLDLFNLNYLSAESLDSFMRAQGFPLAADQLSAFFKAVDLDQDGRITYSELVEAVHLMEPLPYTPSSGILIRQNEIERAIQTNRALERLYLPSYPYYFYPYYPTYYPASFYPYLSLAEIRIRENSLDRLNRSRLAAIESDSRIRQINNEVLENSIERLNRSRLAALESQVRDNSIERLNRSRLAALESDSRIRLINHEARLGLERSRSIDRLNQIEHEGLLRQSRLEDLHRQRELEQVRDVNLRNSRERLRVIESESRLRQLDAESRAINYDREIQLNSIERNNRLRQLEGERNILDSNVRLRSIERLNSLERLRHYDNLRIIDSVTNSQIYSPSKLIYSPVKSGIIQAQIDAQVRDIQIAESILTSKLIQQSSPLKRQMPYY